MNKDALNDILDAIENAGQELERIKEQVEALQKEADKNLRDLKRNNEILGNLTYLTRNG